MKQKRRPAVVAIRLPSEIHDRVRENACREDMDFSKYVRRAIRREMSGSLVGTGLLAMTAKASHKTGRTT